MGFFKSTKGSIISDDFKLMEDVGNFKTGYSCDVALYEDHLEISCIFEKK